MNNENQWAVTDAAFSPLVEFATILGVYFRDESKAVTAIIEQGSFVAYNKVDNPSEIEIDAMLSGDAAAQQQALDTLKKARQSTSLLYVSTPFETYRDMTLVAVQYERTRERGAAQTFVSLRFQEVRQVAVVTSRMQSAAQVKNATSVSRQNVGKSQGRPCSDTQKANIEAMMAIAYGRAGEEA